MFNYDIRPIMDSAIARYGYDEWKANVITDEFHGHLGVFSIVGAKMGIKARELFNVGPDMLNVVTFAGSKPPYSCLTDGIQVSTGATLGMGTIQLATDSISKPSAVFTYKGRSIRITLKKEYLEKVDADIKDGIVKFGLMDDGYWKLIRRNAITYWLEWDRNKIFDIEEMATLSAYAREDSVKRITSLQASKMIEMDRNIVVVDVRTPAEYDAGHIKDAVNIDIKQADAFSKIDTLDPNSTYVVHCRINHRSQIAVDHMKDKGFKNIYQITDGYAGWSQNGLPEVKQGSSTSAP
jgi:pyrimidine-specific ribonucleoside hydrolase